MKSNFILIPILILSLLSCEPIVSFEKPQPANVPSLERFPTRLRGSYFADSSNSFLTISDKTIISSYEFDDVVHKDSLGTNVQLIGDSLIHFNDGKREKISFIGDSIIIHKKSLDTIFLVSNDNVLKRFKGYYFLNIRHGQNNWEVMEISLKNGLLSIGDIDNENQIKNLKEITETLADTVDTHFNPTKKQFKRFMHQIGFNTTETYKRLN